MLDLCYGELGFPISKANFQLCFPYFLHGLYVHWTLIVLNSIQVNYDPLMMSQKEAPSKPHCTWALVLPKKSCLFSI